MRDRDTNPIIPQPGTPTLVSVMVLAYNHGPYIEECLESIARQCVDFSFKIVVGEDCSTDDTRLVVEKMFQKYPELIKPIYHKTNCGMHGNIDAVSKECCGKYLAICEGDDFWQRNDKLQMQVDCMEAGDDVALVCSDLDILFQNSGRLIRNADRNSKGWSRPLADVTTSLLMREIGVGTCTALMRRNDFLRVRKENPYEFSSQWPMEDLQSFIEISRLGRVVHLPDSLATYRILDDSASNTRSPHKLLEFNKKVAEISEHYAHKLRLDKILLNRLRLYYYSEAFRFAMDLPSVEGRAISQSFLEAHPVQPINHIDGFKTEAVKSVFAWAVAHVIFKSCSHVFILLRLIKRNLNNLLVPCTGEREHSFTSKGR